MSCAPRLDRAALREHEPFPPEWGDFGGPRYDFRPDAAPDDEWIVAAADRLSKEAGQEAVQQPDWESAYRILASFARGRYIEPPQPSRQVSIAGAVLRMRDPQWWRSALRVHFARWVESEAISAGKVGPDGDHYVSEESLRRRRQQKARNRRVLGEREAVNEQGDVYNLADLQDRSPANPQVRRAELMTRIRGFEEAAELAGHVCEFYTITCPGRMHARKAGGCKGVGIPNRWYDGTTPGQAQAYLCRLWTRVRSKLKREGIQVYGLRVAEPHKDGCPHWHMLFYMPEASAPRVREILREYALAEDPAEPGARKVRFQAKRMDPRLGKGTGYIAKYIAKNVDGYGLDTGESAAAERVNAWASVWGIRQFQQIGGPSVTVWRELRRADDRDVEGLPPLTLWAARLAADAGDWGAYTRVMDASGGVRLLKVWDDRPNKYGEPRGDQIWGVEDVRNLKVFLITRPHEWEIRSATSGSSADNEEVQHTGADPPAPAVAA